MVLSAPSPARRRRGFRRAVLEAGSIGLAVLLLIWSLTPVYNMFLIALDPEEGEVEFTGHLYPPEISFDGFIDALTQEARYLEHFWVQLGNSIYIGFLTMLATVLIGSLASFAIHRLRLEKSSLLSNAALLTYVVPASFLILPFYKIVHVYGLSDSPWGVIAAQTTLAAPFAILILQQYSRLIPAELDDAARIDGASIPQVYLRIYLPLMMPALAVVAIYALVLAWNDYLYQFVLLSSMNQMTLSITQAQLFRDIDAPWNAMMAAGIIYVLPPVAIMLAFGRYVAAGLARQDGQY